ncbi:MAG: KH domain-containing protein [Synechococcales cyanobacterium RM1_1_8]|nr:KH domain-containing protein [Synechococcales cyanobacterium RM1_1_8]
MPQPDEQSSDERSVSQAPEGTTQADQSQAELRLAEPILAQPIQVDYPALTRFLLEPLVDHPSDLHISYETTAQGAKVWLRVSLGKSERGRAFGRGGRNIRAIRTILRAAAQHVGQSVSLEVLGADGDGGDPSKPRKRGKPRLPGLSPTAGPAADAAPKPHNRPKLKPKDH